LEAAFPQSCKSHESINPSVVLANLTWVLLKYGPSGCTGLLFILFPLYSYDVNFIYILKSSELRVLNFFFLMALGFELRASPWIGRCSNDPFWSGYFGDRVSFFAETGLGCNLPILSFPPLLGLQVPVIALSFFPIQM
jgi:hypothetical protein